MRVSPLGKVIGMSSAVILEIVNGVWVHDGDTNAAKQARQTMEKNPSGFEMAMFSGPVTKGVVLITTKGAQGAGTQESAGKDTGSDSAAKVFAALPRDAAKDQMLVVVDGTLQKTVSGQSPLNKIKAEDIAQIEVIPYGAEGSNGFLITSKKVQ